MPAETPIFPERPGKTRSVTAAWWDSNLQPDRYQPQPASSESARTNTASKTLPERTGILLRTKR
jgi:hypothetical protein